MILSRPRSSGRREIDLPILEDERRYYPGLCPAVGPSDRLGPPGGFRAKEPRRRPDADPPQVEPRGGPGRGGLPDPGCNPGGWLRGSVGRRRSCGARSVGRVVLGGIRIGCAPESVFVKSAMRTISSQGPRPEAVRMADPTAGRAAP